MLVCSFWAVSRTRWAGRGAVGGGGPPRRACRGPSPGHGADAVGAGARGRWGGVQRYRASARRVGAVRAGRASGTTAYRTMAGIDEACLERVWDTAAGVRAAEWSQQCVDPARPLVLDIDSTLVEVHSENKQGAAPHYKRGYGFHPMLCSTGDGDPLWAKLRPGNAAANNIADHLEVLDRSIGQLPEGSAAGHRPGDEPAMAAQPIWVRTDSAGCSTRAAHGARDRNVTFFAAARQSTQITAANRRRSRRPGPLAAHHQEPQAAPRTRPGRRPHRQSRPVGLARGHTADHPAASRCTPARRRTLFDSPNWRCWGFLTDAKGDPARLDGAMRAHARVEDTIAAAQGLRAQQNAVPLLGRQRRMDRAVRHQPRLGHLVPAAASPRRARQSRTQTPPLAAMAHTRTHRALGPTPFGPLSIDEAILNRTGFIGDAPMVVKSAVGLAGGCGATSGIGLLAGGCGCVRVRVLRYGPGGFRVVGRPG